MIYPRLNRARNGQRLSVGLVNGLIKRTEYAADLLQQYKLLAGTNTEVEQSYDGTVVSYSILNDGSGTNPNNPITIEQLFQYYGQNEDGVVVPNNGIIYLQPSASGSQQYTVNISSNYPTEVRRADGSLTPMQSGGTITGAPGYDYNPLTVVVYGGGSLSSAIEINVNSVTTSVDRLISIRL